MQGSRLMQLWIDIAEQQYYLIPDDAVLVEGELLLVSVTGQGRRVVAAEIRAYQIRKTDAQAHMSDQLMRFLDDARERFVGSFDELAGALRGEAALSDDGDSAAVDLFAELVGVTPEMLARNPQIAQQGVQDFVGELATVLDAVFSAESNLTYAHAQARGLSAKLQAAGLAIDGERLESLPIKLHDWYANSDDQAAFASVVTMLQAFASTEQTDVNDWQSLIGHWSRLVQEVANEPTEDDNVRHYNRARQRVRENIIRPKFDFKRVLADYHKAKADE